MSEKIATIIIVIGTLLVFGIVFGIFGLIIYTGIKEANYGIKQGIVIDKQYTSEHTYTEYSVSHIGNETIKIPYQKSVAEKYKIKIQKTVDGKQKNTWVEVPKEEYNNLNIGDSYGNYKEE